MKQNITSTSALCALLTLSVGQIVAHPEGHEPENRKPLAAAETKAAAPASEHGHEHATKAPDSVADIFKAIDKQMDRLTKTVAAKNLEDAHDHGFALRDLSNALIGKVAADKKTSVETAAKKISELATAIDKSSAAGAQKTTESNVKSMGIAVKILKTAAGHHNH